MEERARRVLARADALSTQRTTFESHWQEVSDHLLGRRMFSGTLTPGTKRHDKIYDTTGLHASGLLTVGLHSLLSNPASRWFDVTTQTPELARLVPVREWLDAVTDRLYLALTRPHTNFNSNMLESYVDDVNFGTSVLAMEEIPGEGPIYSAHPLGEFCIDQDRFGRIDTVCRRFLFTARQAKERFGDRAGSAVEKRLTNKKGEESLEFLHMVQPSTTDKRLRYTGTKMPWESIYISKEDGEIVDEGGFWHLPYAVTRWSKNAGSAYADACPGMDALPEARMLNQMSYTVLRAAQKATDPPLLLPNEGVMKPFRVNPGGTSYYDPMFATNGNPVFTLPVDARGVGIGVEMLRDRQQKIQEHFLFEILSMIRDPRMTATQVQAISNSVMRVVAPRLGGIQEQKLEPIVAWAFATELRAGRLPMPPVELAGQTLRVVYQSPVARAQRETDVQAIIQTFGEAQQFAQMMPDILHNLDPDDAIRRVAEFRGVPASVLVSMQDVLERRAHEAQIAQQNAQMQQMGQMSQAVKNVTPAVQAASAPEQQAA